MLSAVLTACALSAQAASPGDTVRAADFGTRPGTYEDALPAIQRAIAACKEKNAAVLVLEPGRYDIWPEHAAEREYFISNTSSETECPSKVKKTGLLFERMENFTLEGNGALLVFHGKMITWVVDDCRNITVKGIRVDFERPSMSELTIAAASDSVVDAAIHPDSRYDIRDGNFQWYGEGWGMKHFHAIRVHTADSTYWYDNWAPFDRSKAARTGPLSVRFRGNFRNRKFVPGDVITVRDPIRDHVGAFINRSENVRLHDVRMHYMHGLGIVAQFSEDLTYDSVFVVPRDNGRHIAAFADCMHFSGCRGQIKIEDCRFNGAHDDPVNVHGTHLMVQEVLGPRKLRLRFGHAQTYGMEAFFAGDSTALLDAASLKIYACPVVQHAKLVSEREMEVEFTKDVTGVKKGDALENVSWTPALTVRNCRFEGTNTRGLLVTTRRKVLIENNVFFRTGMHAILIADDASGWYESGPVTDVTIRGNTFQECAYNSGSHNYTIAIEPEVKKPAPGNFVHRNIRIYDNTFLQYDYPLLFARSTDGLSFTNNRIYRTGFRPSGEARANIRLEDCIHVKVERNMEKGFGKIEVSK